MFSKVRQPRYLTFGARVLGASLTLSTTRLCLFSTSGAISFVPVCWQTAPDGRTRIGTYWWSPREVKRMNGRDGEPSAAADGRLRREVRGRLFRKYVALFVAVVSAALIANGLLEIWFDYQEQRALLVRIQRQQAESAALRITQFVREIEGQLAWSTQLPWNAENLEEWRFDAVRLLRQAPAISEVTQLDASGRAQIQMSRFSADVISPQTDLSTDPAFARALADKTYYGPVYFQRGSEPYMALAMAGVRREYGVVLAQVNLGFIWDVVSQIKVGQRGQAYVVDPTGRLIAHPDIGMVLHNTDLSRLDYVRAALAPQSDQREDADPIVQDAQDRQVLSSHVRILPLGWLVFVDLPIEEAYAPLYASIQRSGALLIGALFLAALAGLYLARRMIIPIRALRDGAARIGSGDLAWRISIKSSDELAALGNQFNRMAAQLQDSYAGLERKVEERTYQLEQANLAKSRFLAVASHDLRQPLHALGLFVAQLRTAASSGERARIVARIDTAIATMNELFKALLDISRLDAGALAPTITDFPVLELLERVDATFAGAATDAGIELRVVPTAAWVRSDFVLLEQILLNLVSNAVRYTTHGGVLVGCRERGERLHIEVWDTGPGIPKDQRQKIFEEFYRLEDADRGRKGLGLGLAIVERLCRLVGHPLDLSSTVGRGSRFTVVVPKVAARPHAAGSPIEAPPALNLAAGKLIVVIDDDALVVDAMAGLLRSWGCRVISAHSGDKARGELSGIEAPPNLIISDFHLAGGKTGIEAIEQLRGTFGAPIPAFLVSGDISPALQDDVRRQGYLLLHKPVEPMTLRTMLNRLLKKPTMSLPAVD
jgi:signal transduction histidine kinase